MKSYQPSARMKASPGLLCRAVIKGFKAKGGYQLVLSLLERRRHQKREGYGKQGSVVRRQQATSILLARPIDVKTFNRRYMSQSPVHLLHHKSLAEKT
jgi:hypothetical protein